VAYGSPVLGCRYGAGWPVRKETLKFVSRREMSCCQVPLGLTNEGRCTSSLEHGTTGGNDAATPTAHLIAVLLMNHVNRRVTSPVMTQTGRGGGAGRVCARSSSGNSVRLTISRTVCSSSARQCFIMNGQVTNMPCLRRGDEALTVHRAWLGSTPTYVHTQTKM